MAGLKTVGIIPTRLAMFRRRLRLDWNERVAEIAFVLGHVSARPGIRILDFGCVESLTPIFLASLGAVVVGVDLRNYEFEHPNFHFVRGDLLEVGLPPGAFDEIVAISAVEHAGLDVYGSSIDPEADRKVVREFHRLLRPSGRLLLTVPYGQRIVTKDLRIYDQTQLEHLLGSFAVEAHEFYVKAEDGSHWRHAPEKEAAGAGYDPVTGVTGVACIVAIKSG